MDAMLESDPGLELISAADRRQAWQASSAENTAASAWEAFVGTMQQLRALVSNAELKRCYLVSMIESNNYQRQLAAPQSPQTIAESVLNELATTSLAAGQRLSYATSEPDPETEQLLVLRHYFGDEAGLNHFEAALAGAHNTQPVAQLPDSVPVVNKSTPKEAPPAPITDQTIETKLPLERPLLVAVLAGEQPFESLPAGLRGLLRRVYPDRFANYP